MLIMASGRSVLPERMGGGPLGLGDPDDKTLRKVEKEVMIPQKMKEKAKKEKCPSEVKVFGECVKNSGFLLPFQCRPQARELRNCLSKWYSEPEFVALCQQEYLEERTQYRRTGIKRKFMRM